jgi:hypothetical protein
MNLSQPTNEVAGYRVFKLPAMGFQDLLPTRVGVEPTIGGLADCISVSKKEITLHGSRLRIVVTCPITSASIPFLNCCVATFQQFRVPDECCLLPPLVRRTNACSSPSSSSMTPGRSPHIQGIFGSRIHWRTKVLIRFGTSPTGITAIIFRAFASTADTDLAPEFEI